MCGYRVQGLVFRDLEGSCGLIACMPGHLVIGGRHARFYWGNIGITEKRMETIRMGYIGYILGLYWENGKYNPNSRRCWGRLATATRALGTFLGST